MTTGRVLLILVLIIVFSAFMSAATAVPNRIAGNVDNDVTLIKDNVHRFARAEFDLGKVEGAFSMQRITMGFKLSAAQQADLESLLQQQADPNSPNYHKWLTPAEYGKRFGLSDADYGKVTAWLKGTGFQIVDVPASRTSITFSGTAAQVEAAFRTQIHKYVVDGESHYANATSPAIPAAFADVVLGFGSLNDFKPKPLGITSKVNPYFTSEISGSHFLVPADLATIYNVNGLYSAGYTGAGQKIVVVGQSSVNTTDIAAFRAAAGLSATLPTLTLVPGTTAGTSSGDVTEATLDLEWTGGIAKDAAIIYVHSNSVFTSMEYAITNNVAPVISISYGLCESSISSAESQLLNQFAQQANVQGITLIAATGDSGAAGCDYSSGSTKITSAAQGLAVSLPASLPGVTAIGGTTFNEGTGTYWNTTNDTNTKGSALSYIPEVVWNDTAIAGDLMATGGGKSTLFAKPSWQTGTGVPADSMRDLPDISLAASPAHDPYLICSQGRCVSGFRDASGYLDTIGGTSAGAPVFAGILALINQRAGTAQGNINPKLYGLAASAPSAFHDITSGDNSVPCTTGTTDCPSGGTIGYLAGTGYDLATGLGSIDAYALASVWGPATPPTTDPPAPPAPPADFSLTSTPTTVAVTSTSPATATITLSPLNGFSGTVAWTCSVSSALTSYAFCTMSPDTTTPNAKATVTISSLRTTGMLQPSSTSLMCLFAVAMAPFGVMVFGPARKGTSRVVMYGVFVIALLAMVLGMAGCGGGSQRTTTPAPYTPPSVSGAVTVQATSGTTSHTVSITTTVN